MKAKTKTTPRARKAHPKPDPIYAAIDKHVAAVDAIDGPRAEKNRLEGTGGKADKPGFAAAERKYDRALGVESDVMDALISTRPTTAEGLAAFAMYIRVWHRWEHGHLDRERATTLQAMERASRSIVRRPYSPAFEHVKALVSKIDARAVKRQKEWRESQAEYQRSAKGKQDAKERRKLRNGVIVAEAGIIREVRALLDDLMAGGKSLIRARKQALS